MQTSGTELSLLERVQLIRKDPWEFCSTCVFTLDQTDKVNPVKRFPVDLKYLKLYARLWNKERFIAVPKSRRMFMSWMNIALYLWDTMFNIGRANAFVSKKEDDADELIKRAKFILEHIPEDLIPKDLIPKYEYTYGKLKFPELNSTIQGFPQGSDQLRQFTLSGILGDEMAFWDDAQLMYSASFPTLEGGGRFTAISSPGPGFFKQLVFDELDDKTILSTDKEKEVSRFPLDGVEVWKNAKNKFTVFQLHYSANPIKKDPKYRENVKAAMPIAQYLQEYELQWDSFSGKPVYMDWNKAVHGSKTTIQPEFGLPLLLGFDFGLSPACIVCQLQDEKLVVLKEITATNMGAERFLDIVVKELAISFPEWSNLKKDFITFIDASGFFRKDTDETTCAMIIAKRFSPQAGAITWEERRHAVEKFLIKYTKAGSCFQVDLANCPLLVRGFDGGYRYPEKSFEIEPNKIRPMKDIHSHIHDALQMVCSRLERIHSPRLGKLPRPQYSFGMKGNRTRKGDMDINGF